MADVTILPPQNFLNHHNHHHHRHNHRQPHHHPNSTTNPTRRTHQLTTVGPTRILKRGEDSDGFYAGFGFVTSPPPSSVPLPAFFTSARRNCGGVATTTEADIASGLKRLLNLH